MKSVIMCLSTILCVLVLSSCQSNNEDNYLPGVAPASGNTMTSPNRSGFELVHHVVLDPKLKHLLVITGSDVQNLDMHRNMKVDVIKIDTSINTDKDHAPEKTQARNGKDRKDPLEVKTRKKLDPISFKIDFKNIDSSFWDWLRACSPYWIAYRVYWFLPANSNSQPPESQWILRKIVQNETFSISATAPNNECKNFIVKLFRVKEGTPFFVSISTPPEPTVPASAEAVKKASSSPKPMVATEPEDTSDAVEGGEARTETPATSVAPSENVTKTQKEEKGKVIAVAEEKDVKHTSKPETEEKDVKHTSKPETEKKDVKHTPKPKADKEETLTDYLNSKDETKNLNLAPTKEQSKKKKAETDIEKMRKKRDAGQRMKVIKKADEKLKKEQKFLDETTGKDTK